MEKEKNKSSNKFKVIIKCILIIFIYGIIRSFLNLIFGKIGYFQENEFMCFLVRDVLLFFVLITYLYFTNQIDVLKFNRKKFLKGVIICLPLIIMVVFVAIMNSSTNINGGYNLLPFFKIIICILACMMIGLTEETLFRGIVLNNIFQVFGRNTRKNVLLSITISSLLFMLVHLTNVFDSNSNLLSASYQAFVSFFGGLTYGAIYARSKSIYAVSFTHGIQDISGSIESGFFGKHKALTIFDTNKLEATVLALKGGLIVCVLNLILFIFLMRKKKEFEYIENE